MADYNVIENEYGKYGAYPTLDNLKEPEYILDNHVSGTIDDVIDYYFSGNLGYSDDLYALLHDVYGNFSDFPQDCKDDVEIASAAIRFGDDYSIDELNPEVLEFKENVMTILDKIDESSNKYNAFMELFNKGVDGDVLADKEVALRWVTYRADTLQDVSPELQDDKDVVLAAVKHDSQALKYASDRLRDDKEIVLAALKVTDCYGLIYASDNIKDNEEVLKVANRLNGSYMKFASERLKDNPELTQTWAKDLIGKDIAEARNMLGRWFICRHSDGRTHQFEHIPKGTVTLITGGHSGIVTAVSGLDEMNKKWNAIHAFDRATAKQKEIDINQNVKEWCLSNNSFKTGYERINPDITFKDVFDRINKGENIDDIIGIKDKVVKNDIVLRISDVFNIDSRIVFNKVLEPETHPELEQGQKYNDKYINSVLETVPMGMKFFDDSIRNNIFSIMRACRADGNNLQLLSDAAKDNKMIIEYTISYHPDAIVHASKRLQEEFQKSLVSKPKTLEEKLKEAQTKRNDHKNNDLDNHDKGPKTSNKDDLDK